MSEQVERGFHENMSAAQLCHSKGDYDEAIDLWERAASQADNKLDVGRAVRGIGSSAQRAGRYERARDNLEGAYWIHDSLVEENPKEAENYSERAESARVLGRHILGLALDGEYSGLESVDEARRAAQSAIELFDQAQRDMDEYESRTEELHQHAINLPYIRSAAHSFYGDREIAKSTASDALRLGFKAESQSLQRSANISLKHRLTERAIYIVRGVAAKLIYHLSAKPGTRRRHLANNIHRRVG